MRPLSEIEAGAATIGRVPFGALQQALESGTDWWHVLREGVPDLCAQVRADDALLLSLEWGAHHDECPCCSSLPEDVSRTGGHDAGCSMKARCDEARARLEGGS